MPVDFRPMWRPCPEPEGDRRSQVLPRNALLMGDARDVLRQLPTASVDTVITSPPYFALRDYGQSGQLGQEANVFAWALALRQVLREVGRVVKPTGSLWLNLGDSYSRHPKYGAPPKSLLLAPERLLLGLAADGWTVRNKVVWAKSNPVPSSISDRLTPTHEYIYFLVRSPRYFFDLDAIREPLKSTATPRTSQAPMTPRPHWAGPLAASRSGLGRLHTEGRTGHPDGKNPGDVWTLSTSRYRGAHFATFPPQLITRPLLATTPEKVCPTCGLPWTRPRRPRPHSAKGPATGELVAVCSHQVAPVPGLVLDPFMGTGTVGAVAQKRGRDWLGIELNPDYAELAAARLGVQPTRLARCA